MQAYIHARIQTKPLEWQSVCQTIVQRWPDLCGSRWTLYGIWRNQIGRCRDELNLFAHASPQWSWSDAPLKEVDKIVSFEAWSMSPTLRPTKHTPLQRQGNYAFRHFQTNPDNWDEFLKLCADAWPGFEASYPDCEVMGLWRYCGIDENLINENLINAVMLTRRPNLAAWERTKIPQTEAEAEVRRTLSKRYDLCTSTYVHTTTLMTASDTADTTRWT
ncbi:MAG: hypothetical protein ACR2PG_17350 [Hyphomicrobiaceae bacterium]